MFANLPKFHRGGFWLFIVAAATSALLADHPLAAQLTLNGHFARDLALWQPVSAIFLYPEGHLGGLIGTFLLQWFIGGHLEERWGTARYLTFVLGAAALGYLVTGLLGLVVPAVFGPPELIDAAARLAGVLEFSMGGTLPADLAAVVGFGVVYGRQPVQLFGALPISARALAGLVTALMLLGPLLRGAWPQAVPVAVAALCALGLAWRWRTPPSSGKVAARKGGRRPRHLQVVDNAPSRPGKLLN